MVPKAIEEITRLLPERTHTFTGSDSAAPKLRFWGLGLLGSFVYGGAESEAAL